MTRLWDTLDPLFSAADEAAANDAFGRLVGSFGAACFTYAALSLGPGRRGPLVTTTMPPAWFGHYRDQHYHTVDWVVQQARRSLVPFTWSGERDHAVLSPAQRRIMGEARAFGICAGLAIPIHGPQGQFALVSMTAERERDLAPLEHGMLLQAAALHYHARRVAAADTDADAPPVVLTAREAECLTWAAQGKSAWEIGCILAISRHTVQEHLTNAKRKLGCHTREHAVVKAVTLGLITP